MPSGIAIIRVKNAAIAVSGSVTGRRLTISAPTGTSYWSETPSSPRRAPPSQSAYWTTSGRPSPMAARKRATTSGLASGPAMTSTGSPGSTRIATKTRTETKPRVTASATTRRTTYPRTAVEGRLLRPADLGQIARGQRQVLPDPLHALLRHGQAGMHEQPRGRCVLDQQPLHLQVEIAARVVVQGDLGFLEQLLETRTVVPEVVLRVGVVRDVPSLGVADDGEVVLGLPPDAREPPPPFDLLQPDAHTHLLELADDDLARPHGVVVLRRHAQHGLEPAGIPGLGQELPGLAKVVGHGSGEIHEVRVQRVDVGAEDAPHAEHGAVQDLALVEGVGQGATHPDVRERLLAVVHGQDHVVGGAALDHREPWVTAKLGDVLGAEAEERGVDVARLQRGLSGVGIGDEAESDALQLGQALDVVVRVPGQRDAVAAHPVAEPERPRPEGRALERLHGLPRIDHRTLPRQVEQEVRVQALEREGDRVLVLDDYVADGRVVAGIRVLGLGVHRPLEDELDVRGLQFAAVVKAHPALEEEGVVPVVAGVPALGQPRHDLAVPVDLHQALLDVVKHDPGGG